MALGINVMKPMKTPMPRMRIRWMRRHTGFSTCAPAPARLACTCDSVTCDSVGWSFGSSELERNGVSISEF